MEIQIQALQSHHDIEGFSCGQPELDGWLRSTAKQHARKGISRTFVATTLGNTNQVLGFYSLTVGEAETEKLPTAIAKTLPRKIPIALLARLAVATPAQGQGIGKYLLVNALLRTVRVASEVGIAAILVDAKDQSAADFYRHFGFQPMPDSPSRLILLVSTAAGLF